MPLALPLPLMFYRRVTGKTFLHPSVVMSVCLCVCLSVCLSASLTPLVRTRWPGGVMISVSDL